MTGSTFAVTIQLPTRPDSEGCAVLVIVIGARGMPEVVADGLGIVAAVKLAGQVRARLDEGHDIAALLLALDLENEGIPA